MTADRLKALAERIERAMRAAETSLMRQRYAAKRTKREPYEDFQKRRLTAMAAAALKVMRPT